MVGSARAAAFLLLLSSPRPLRALWALKTVRVAMEGSGDEDWSAQLSAPWNAPQDVDVSVGKKFSVASLADLQVPSFGN